MTIDIKKLKIDWFDRIKVVNFPSWYDIGIKSISSDPDMILYYIDDLYDVDDFIDLCAISRLPKQNRVIVVYRKGRKDGVNRDTVCMPFWTNPDFAMKAPMLCSISNELSAFVMMYIR